MKFSGMTPVEVQFVRLYVTTLRRDYYLLRSVMDLMSPSTLNVRSFTDATKMALELEEMHKDFEAQLSRVQKKDHIRKINFPAGPTIDELTEMFSLSFFKLVTVEEDLQGPTKKEVTNDGWFSGKPTEWKKTLTLYKNTPKDYGSNMPDLLSNFFNTLLKFFPFDNTKKWHDTSFGFTNKVWPPKNDEDDDQYLDDDDDSDSSPFDMFFDDDED